MGLSWRLLPNLHLQHLAIFGHRLLDDPGVFKLPGRVLNPGVHTSDSDDEEMVSRLVG